MVDLTNAQDSVEIVIGTTATGAVVTVKKGSEGITAAGDGNYDVDIDEGDNTITVDVLAPNFVATKTYTLTINRASSNASDDDRLRSLNLSPGMLMPAFDPAKLPTGDNGDSDGTSAINAHPYAARVANSVESLTVRAQAAHSGAMVNINSAQDSSVSEGAVDLVVNDNVITITVTAEDRGGPKFYQVTVTRASSTASANTTLSTLSVTPAVGGTPGTAVALSDLDKKFAHMVDLTNAQDSVEIVIAKSEADAVVTVKKGSEGITAAGDGNYDVDIDEGDNTITVDVLAPNFVATKTYTLTINRASSNASDDDSLSSLSLSQGMLMPAFDPAKLPTGDNGDSDGTSAANAHPYAERVANSVESLTVVAQAAHSGAMVNISSAQDSSVSEGAVDPGCRRQCHHNNGDG